MGLLFYAQELLLGLLGLGAATLPLLLPAMKPLLRFLCIAGALVGACFISAALASFFFKIDVSLTFIRAFLMIGLLQNIAIRIPVYPTIQQEATKDGLNTV